MRLRGGVTTFIRKKLVKISSKAYPPPPPPTQVIQKLLNFRIICKMLTPPLGSNSDSFEFENILTAEDPLGQTSEKGYFGIITLKMGMFFSYLLLGCLRVIYNSDIFEKSYYGNFSQIFLYRNSDLPLTTKAWECNCLTGLQQIWTKSTISHSIWFYFNLALSIRSTDHMLDQQIQKLHQQIKNYINRLRV